LQRVLTTVTLLGLLVATAAAFAITEHLKLVKSDILGVQISNGVAHGKPTAKTVFSPVCNCLSSRAIVGIKLRNTGRVTVTIVDSHHDEVRTIRSDVLMRARHPEQFAWDGRTDTGAVAPDGVYHPWVHLPRHTYRFTNDITVDTKAPQVQARPPKKSTLFAGAGRTVAIGYTLSEKAHVLVYLEGRKIIKGHATQTTDRIKWTGRRNHRPLPAGTYVLSIGAEDLAGNVTPAAKRKTVTIVVSYIQLTPERITVRSGHRLTVHVETAAKRYTWRIGQRHGARHGKVLRLRAPTTPGTYRLVVAENRHTATAVVQVRRK
jgi:hypothetical protein